MRDPRQKRGSLMLGMAALIVILGTMCAVVLGMSMQAYRGTDTGADRMRGQAAAEGAALLLAIRADRTGEEITLGECRVTFGAPDAVDGGMRVPLAIVIQDEGFRAFEARYEVMLEATGDGAATVIAAVERVP